MKATDVAFAVFSAVAAGLWPTAADQSGSDYEPFSFWLT